jgi:hypothetical protein
MKSLRGKAFTAAMTAFVSMVLGLALGCAEQSPKKVVLDKFPEQRITDTGGTKVSFNRSVDILFVIDDSGSMSEHQKNLAKNVQLFTQAILGNQILDYHIGIVTSNMDSAPWSPAPGVAWKGELWGTTKYVDRTTPGGAAILEGNLKPGTSGSGSEMFFTPVEAALTAPLVNGVNAGFYRRDAFLAIIFLTDSDDQSQMSSGDFFKFLVNLKSGDPTKVITYGVNIPTKDTRCSRSGEPDPLKLEAFYKLSSAQTLGLCDPDFGIKLAELGADLVRRVGSVLYLTRPAQRNTIVVSFGTQIVPNDARTGWVFDSTRNAIVFGDEMDLKPEPVGTQVEVDFIAAEY